MQPDRGHDRTYEPLKLKQMTKSRENINTRRLHGQSADQELFCTRNGRSIMALIAFILFFMLVALVNACSPARRLERLVEKHPELTIADTLVLRDTVAIAENRADTSVLLAALSTPMYISQGRLEMQVVVEHDTLRLAGKCRADTIYRIRIVPVEKIKLVKTGYPGIRWLQIPWIRYLLGVILALAILRAWRSFHLKHPRP
jgi:hypothetical protein